MLAPACGGLDVVTASYGTLEEAVAEGAVADGWVPRGLPPGTTDIREAHSSGTGERWGLFSFPPSEADTLRDLLGEEVPFEGQRATPPRRIEWWPLLLRGTFDGERLQATGLRGYAAREGDLMFAVNWAQGRAYYWTPAAP